MKKLTAIIFSVFILISTLSAKEELFSFSAGLSSGIPIYGSGSIITSGNDIPGKSRVIIGALGSLNINPIKQVSFCLGTDMLWDFTWSSTEKANKMHVSFPLGVKVYPGLGGFNVGLAYTLGFRTDFINTNAHGEYNGTTPWGNGFKISAEYNFAHEGKSKYFPSVGGYWNFMPRGNYSVDNIIAFYVTANF